MAYYNTATNTYDVVELTNPLINQLPWKDWLDNYTSEIGSIVVTNNGTRYTEPPTVTIIGGTATAQAYISNGGVYEILVTNGGSGYTTPPTVVISGGGPYVTSTATAIASSKLFDAAVKESVADFE